MKPEHQASINDLNEWPLEELENRACETLGISDLMVREKIELIRIRTEAYLEYLSLLNALQSGRITQHEFYQYYHEITPDIIFRWYDSLYEGLNLSEKFDTRTSNYYSKDPNVFSDETRREIINHRDANQHF